MIGRRLAAAVIVALLPAVASAADTAERLCPILKSIAAAGGGMPEMVQANLVMAVAEAWDYDHDALMAVLDDADAATGAACPQDRAAVLAATGKPTLTEAMR